MNTRLRPVRRHRITRFQVMAVLQTARARAFGLNADEAKSWGLNRALFYAAAKRGWQRAKAVGAKRPVITEFETSQEYHDPVYTLGGEKAFRARDFSKGLRFKFGTEVQLPEDFDHQIKARFGSDWDSAWNEATDIIKSADRRDLDIQSRFFNVVYKPRRDVLAEKWSALGTEKKPSETAEKASLEAREAKKDARSSQDSSRKRAA